MDRTGFKVEPCKYGTSPDIQKAIWHGQHVCVSEGLCLDLDVPLTSEQCGKAIVKHQLAGDRGHYSVLNFASIKLNCEGFPHSVVAQITRHRDSAFLVQSNRYTGDRFLRVADGSLKPEEVFYFRPPGRYAGRNGMFWVTQEMGEQAYEAALRCCQIYAGLIDMGVDYEVARSCILYDFRQNFTIACTIEAFWHWLDQRTKADAQWEIRQLADLAIESVYPQAPELMQWYIDNRKGKAKLAP